MTRAAEPTDSPSGTFAIVVVNFGSHELIRDNLSWAQPGEDAPCLGAVVVVDNWRSKYDQRAIEALSASRGWLHESLATNVGFGAAANIGVERAWSTGCDVVILVNPDLALTHVGAAALAAAALTAEDTLVAPTIVGPDGRPWGQLGAIDHTHGRLLTSGGSVDDGWLSGACLALSRSVWSAVPGFTADYFMYWEDVDYCHRLLRAGGRLAVMPDVVGTHAIGGTQGGKSSLYFYYNCRNRLLFAARNLTPRETARWIVHAPADARRVMSRGQPLSLHRKLVRAVPPTMAGCVVGTARAVAVVIAKLAGAVVRRGRSHDTSPVEAP